MPDWRSKIDPFEQILFKNQKTPVMQSTLVDVVQLVIYIKKPRMGLALVSCTY